MRLLVDREGFSPERMPMAGSAGSVEACVSRGSMQAAIRLTPASGLWRNRAFVHKPTFGMKAE